MKELEIISYYFEKRIASSKNPECSKMLEPLYGLIEKFHKICSSGGQRYELVLLLEENFVIGVGVRFKTGIVTGHGYSDNDSQFQTISEDGVRTQTLINKIITSLNRKISFAEAVDFTLETKTYEYSESGYYGERDDSKVVYFSLDTIKSISGGSSAT